MLTEITNDAASEVAPTSSLRLRSVSGWTLEQLVQLEDRARVPGSLLRYTLTASDLRRQVIFAVLASGAAADPDGFLHRLGTDDRLTCPHASLAYAIKTRRVEPLLEAAFGPVQGLVGALRRIGPDPLDHPHVYRVLHQHLCDDGTAPALAHGAITSERINALSGLDPMFCISGLPPITVQEAHALTASIDVLAEHCSMASEKVLAFSARELRDTSVESWLGRWVQRLDRFAEPPVPGDAEVVPLRSAKEMRDAAKRFRNCLGKDDKIVAAAAGVSSFYEATEHQVIAQVDRICHGDLALVVGLWGKGNRRPSRAARRALRDRFWSWGIPTMTRKPLPVGWQQIAGLDEFCLLGDLED